jgi:hypothetical protein
MTKKPVASIPSAKLITSAGWAFFVTSVVVLSAAHISLRSTENITSSTSPAAFVLLSSALKIVTMSTTEMCTAITIILPSSPKDAMAAVPPF